MTTSLEGITLPDDIQWTDEFSGHGVGQVIEPTLTGALVIEETIQQKGRQITLASNNASWVPRSTVLLLETLVATPLTSGQTLTLLWGDSRTFEVVFDRSRGSGLRAVEVKRLAAGVQTSSHWYTIELNLLTA